MKLSVVLRSLPVDCFVRRKGTELFYFLMTTQLLCVCVDVHVYTQIVR